MAEKVKIYGSTKCSNCSMAKDYLTQKGIKYDFYDVTKDRDAFTEMREISAGARSIPVIVVCDRVLIGFEQAVLEEALSCLG